MADLPATKTVRFQVRRRVVLEERAVVELVVPLPSARWEGKRAAERLAEERQHELTWTHPLTATYFSAHRPA